MKLSFKRALQSGYVKPYRNKAYLVYLSGLTCPCGAPACEAHHLIAAGFGGGMGTKASDIFALPICRECHDEIHRDVKAWEELFGSQWEHICMALHQAVSDGVLHG